MGCGGDRGGRLEDGGRGGQVFLKPPDLCSRRLALGQLRSAVLHGRERRLQLRRSLPPLAFEVRLAGGGPDELGALLVVAAAQYADPEGAVGGDSRSGVARHVAGDRVEEPSHRTGIHLSAEAVRHSHCETVAQRARDGLRRSRNQLAAGQLEDGITGDTGHEQARGLERGLDAGALIGSEVGLEVGQVGEAVLRDGLPAGSGRFGLCLGGQLVDERLRFRCGGELAV